MLIAANPFPTLPETNMTTEDTRQLAAVIRANRFYIRSEAIQAMATHFEETVPGFERELFYHQIDRKPYQPKTGAACLCHKGLERDNCPDCEGTGMRIDFAKIRAAHA